VGWPHGDEEDPAAVGESLERLVRARVTVGRPHVAGADELIIDASVSFEDGLADDGEDVGHGPAS
jgi:hypothetical protein